MTEAEVLRLCELPSGRELDEAVATHVLGWKKHGVFSIWELDGRVVAHRRQLFSTDLTAAAIVLNHAVKQGWYPEMSYGDGLWEEPGWDVRMGYVLAPRDAHADTLPLAICRAALKAASHRDGAVDEFC